MRVFDLLKNIILQIKILKLQINDVMINSSNGNVAIGSLGIEWGRISFLLPPNNIVQKNIVFINNFKEIPLLFTTLSDDTNFPEAVSATGFADSVTSGIIRVKANVNATYSWNISYLVIGKINPSGGGYCIRRFLKGGVWHEIIYHLGNDYKENTIKNKSVLYCAGKSIKSAKYFIYSDHSKRFACRKIFGIGSGKRKCKCNEHNDSKVVLLIKYNNAFRWLFTLNHVKWRRLHMLGTYGSYKRLWKYTVSYIWILLGKLHIYGKHIGYKVNIGFRGCVI